jgi:CheY-like chemotaxis protein
MSLPSKKRKLPILIAEDDPDDRFLLEVAFADFDGFFELRFVENGEELMEYLHHQGEYAKSMPPKPGLILLDLNMPRKDGRQALVEIKGREDLKDIPLIIWTTSNEEEDRIFCAEAGASAYVTKPSSYLELDAAIRDIVEKWAS